MPDQDSCSDINVRSSSYLIARTVAACSCCHQATRLLALALPILHETLSLEPNIEAGEVAGEIWDVADCNAFLFYIEYLPDAVQRRLRLFSGTYRLGYSAATLGSYWANHCEKCGSHLDDHELFCEPEGAFLPTSAAGAAVIELIRIDEGIEAATAGYACDPEFFESMVLA
jgi:hypothetical protein